MNNTRFLKNLIALTKSLENATQTTGKLTIVITILTGVMMLLAVANILAIILL